jgi:hypothetical protein
VSVNRPKIVEPEADSGAAEFEVDSHGAQSEYEEPSAGAGAQQPETPDVPPAVAASWTPEEATQLICAIWNFGMLIYGPEWAAHPAETAGWNISAAQLLDQFLPKGTGGFVELGAGLIMVGNGLAMMGVRRVPIIQRGPKPMWVRRQTGAGENDSVVSAGTAAAAPSASGSNGSGKYRMPSDIAPATTDPLNGIGL